MSRKKLPLSATTAIGPATFSTLKPQITISLDQYKQAGYKNEHALIEEKIVPKSIQLLATELALPHNAKIAGEAQKGSNFEECLGILAARLDIALDGSYDAGELCDVLLKALQRRKPGAVQQHHEHDPRLKNARMIEKVDSVTLEEVGDQHGVKLKEAAEGEGPYTICRTCINSYECITNRTCKNGTPAQQLGNTMKVLKETMQ